MLEILIGTILMVALIMGVYHLGKIDGRNERLEKTIPKYIKTHWPDQYAAYQRGIQEGYAAGLSDSGIFPKEPPDEPA